VKIALKDKVRLSGCEKSGYAWIAVTWTFVRYRTLLKFTHIIY